MPLGSATLGMMMVLEGWNDGSLGPVIPFLQRYYHVRALIPSSITKWGGELTSI